jgi:hypothetical protein
MTTQELAGQRLIRAAKEDATWIFYTLDAQADGVRLIRPPRQRSHHRPPQGVLSLRRFLCRRRRVYAERRAHPAVAPLCYRRRVPVRIDQPVIVMLSCLYADCFCSPTRSIVPHLISIRARLRLSDALG